MHCKICSFKAKNNISLARHLRFNHNISFIDYKIKYESFKIPKCKCGKKVDYKDGTVFRATCGDKVCVKNNQRNKRLEFMKNNPEQTAWRTKNLSYPEKIFIELLEKHKLDKQYSIIREKSFFPYFVDFAFEGVNVAVEIDGGQHELPERKESDKKKNALLNSLGWRVFRVTAIEVMREGDSVIYRLREFMGSNKFFDNCGIKSNKTIKQLERENLKKQKLIELQQNNGLTIKKKENCLSQRRVERPTFERLQQEIKELGYTGTGKKYGVSDNAIRKWIKTYIERNF